MQGRLLSRFVYRAKKTIQTGEDHPVSLQVVASNVHKTTSLAAVSQQVVVGLPDAPTLPADAVTAAVGKITLKWTAPQTNDFIGTQCAAGGGTRGQQPAGTVAATRLTALRGQPCIFLHNCTPVYLALHPPPTAAGTPPFCTAPPTSPHPSSALSWPPAAPPHLAPPASARMWPCRPAPTAWRLPPPTCMARGTRAP